MCGLHTRAARLIPMVALLDTVRVKGNAFSANICCLLAAYITIPAVASLIRGAPVFKLMFVGCFYFPKYDKDYADVSHNRSGLP